MLVCVYTESCFTTLTYWQYCSMAV